MSDETQFGRLERVDLRAAWQREDTHFTPWLADDANLKLLGDTIGVELELEAQEEYVGPFRADLLCKDTVSGSFVLIENQIERTDHTHLGQLITYAAGLDAVTVVWIAARFTEEHRAALDWLNEISHEDIRFFGLEVELWRIGTSPVAPKFNMVAKPNDWSKAVRESRSGGATSEHQDLRRLFWRALLDRLDATNSRISGNRTPSRAHWMSWGLGRSGFRVTAVVGFRDGFVGVELVVNCNDHLEGYDALRAQAESINREFGIPLDWDFDPDRRQNYARYRRTDVDPMNQDQWPELVEWLREQMERLEQVFRGRVAALP